MQMPSDRPVALITGAARGIGHAIAMDLGRDHDIAITWHRSAPGHDHGLALQCDLTQDGACADVIDAVIARYGRLDVIVNNAGLVASTPLDQFDPKAHRAIFDLNVGVPAALLAAALPHLRTGAAIVNISSMNAELPPMGAAAYGASKAALNLWTRGMAKELGPRGIRVNAVAPGAIEVDDAPRPDDLVQLFVDQTALGLVGRPEDIARAVRFMATEASGFVTGEVLTVSGGYRL